MERRPVHRHGSTWPPGNCRSSRELESRRRVGRHGAGWRGNALGRPPARFAQRRYWIVNGTTVVISLDFPKTTMV
jgi:hypothetical protein